MEQNDKEQSPMGRGLLTDTTSYLKASDYEIDDEAEDDEYWARTHLTCASCKECINYDEEVIAIIVVQAQYIVLPDEETGKPRGRVEFYPVLNDDDEDFTYEPLLLHFDCWDETCEEYHELIADEPRIRSRSPATDICKCSFCNAGIGRMQEFARVVIGEIGISERKEQPTFKESEGGSPEPVCLGCMERVNEQCIELWNS